MASEIRVDKINSLSGVGTVTLSPTGVDIAGITTAATLKVGTGITASSDGDIFATGITTIGGVVNVGSGITLSPEGNSFITGVSTFTGDITANGRLRVTGPSTITNNAQTIIAIDSADDHTVGLGGKIGLAGLVNGTKRTYAAVGGLKAVDGTGDFAGHLALYTRRNNQSDLDERLRITSGGNVGINSTVPTNVFTVDSTSNNQFAIKSDDSNADIILADTGGSARVRHSGTTFEIWTGGVAGSYYAQSAARRMQIDSSGNTTLNTGNLVIGTSGKGIDFSATGDAGGMSSELLDDYEEGDFTPTFSNGSGSITVNAYSIQYGKYVKIGKMVYVEGGLRANVTNNSSGTYDIGGLPFTSANTDNSSGMLHGKEQSAWTVAPHHFSTIQNTDKARARGGIDVGDLSLIHI